MNETGGRDKMKCEQSKDEHPKYRCPYCGSHEIYAATWVTMNPPRGEIYNEIQEVEDPRTGEVMPVFCGDCFGDIYGVDHLVDKDLRERWQRAHDRGDEWLVPCHDTALALSRERRRMLRQYKEEPGPDGPVETYLELADEIGALAQSCCPKTP